MVVKSRAILSLKRVPPSPIDFPSRNSILYYSSLRLCSYVLLNSILQYSTTIVRSTNNSAEYILRVVQQQYRSFLVQSITIGHGRCVRDTFTDIRFRNSKVGAMANNSK